jgi:hypothetical protein
LIDVRALAEFRADFPDDGLENESGFLLFPGKSATGAIAEILRGVGCEVSEPLHAHDHGWELEVAFRNERMWCQVTSLGEEDHVLLFIDGPFMGYSSSNPSYLEAIARLNLAMQGSPRFRDIRWRRWKGPDGPAAAAPLDVDLERLPEPAPKRTWFGWGAKKADTLKSSTVSVRNKAKIGTNFPADAVQENGKIIQWGGRAVAMAIAEILRRLGAEVSEPISAVEQGWRLDIRYGGVSVRWQVEDGGGFVYLDMDDRLVAERSEYVELVVQSNAELRSDPRFHNIRWYRRDEINMRGLSSNSPVGPTP